MIKILTNQRWISTKTIRDSQENKEPIFCGAAAPRHKKPVFLLNRRNLIAIALSTLFSIPSNTNAETYINNRVCPADFPNLSKALAKDLPDYLNRVYSRLRIKREVMTISQPELEPLPLAPDQARDRLPEQIFLSVLERQTGRAETSQRAYWLFVVPTSKGWRLDMAFMRIGQAPPVDVSDAAIADAANKWLRDYCDPRYKL